MKSFEFTLTYALPADLDLSSVEDRLSTWGCDDALPGFGRPGRLGLAFLREADSLEVAMQHAINDVKRALPEFRLIEARPGL